MRIGKKYPDDLLFILNCAIAYLINWLIFNMFAIKNLFRLICFFLLLFFFNSAPKMLFYKISQKQFCNSRIQFMELLILIEQWLCPKSPPTPLFTISYISPLI